jgi:hypothetical protein
MRSRRPAGTRRHCTRSSAPTCGGRGSKYPIRPTRRVHGRRRSPTGAREAAPAWGSLGERYSRRSRGTRTAHAAGPWSGRDASCCLRRVAKPGPGPGVASPQPRERHVSARSGCRHRASPWCGHDNQPNPGVDVGGLRKSYGDLKVLDGATCRSRRAMPSRARSEWRRQDHDCPDPLHADRVRRRQRPDPRPRCGPPGRRGAQSHRRHRAVLRRGQPAHRRGEPPAHGRPQSPGARRGSTPGGRAAAQVRSGRRGRKAAEHLLRWDGAHARSGDDACRRPACHFLGRAHRRP